MAITVLSRTRGSNGLPGSGGIDDAVFLLGICLLSEFLENTGEIPSWVPVTAWQSGAINAQALMGVRG
jgi:hypothetical protein